MRLPILNAKCEKYIAKTPKKKTKKSLDRKNTKTPKLRQRLLTEQYIATRTQQDLKFATYNQTHSFPLTGSLTNKKQSKIIIIISILQN